MLDDGQPYTGEYTDLTGTGGEDLTYEFDEGQVALVREYLVREGLSSRLGMMVLRDDGVLVVGVDAPADKLAMIEDSLSIIESLSIDVDLQNTTLTERDLTVIQAELDTALREEVQRLGVSATFSTGWQESGIVVTMPAQVLEQGVEARVMSTVARKPSVAAVIDSLTPVSQTTAAVTLAERKLASIVRWRAGGYSKVAEYRDDDPVRSAKWLSVNYPGSGASQCTAGPLFIASYSPYPYRMVTAGHCDESGTLGINVKFSTLSGTTVDPLIGTVQGNNWYSGSNADTLSFSLPTGYDGIARVMLTGDNYRWLSGRIDEADQTVGQKPYCHGGVGLVDNTGVDYVCGTVTATNVTFQSCYYWVLNCFSISDQNCINRAAYTGDSGGLVWKNYISTTLKAAVIGTVSFGNHVNPETCYTPINNIEQIWNYTLVLSAP